MFNKFPKHTGIYHIRDNIEHLELRIRLRHVNSLLKLPKFALNKNQVQKGASASADDDIQTKVTRIRWQQKLLSPSEAELYKELANCPTDTQKKYHRWLMDEAAADDAAGGVPKQDEKSKAKKRSKRPPKAVQEQRKVSEFQSMNEIFTFVHADNFVPLTTSERRRRQHRKATAKNTAAEAELEPEAAEAMYVYAALSPDTQLVTLHWHPRQRMLYIYPDFNSLQDNPYFIEIDTDYRHLYAYAVENTSKQRRPEAALDEAGIAITASNYLQLLLPDMPTSTHWNAEHDLAAQFAMPPKRTKRISLLFEIREAQNFEYDNLHVRYHIRLPPNTLHEEGLLEASTHSVAAALRAGRRRCHFGYTWQLTLLCEEDYDPSARLQVYFELISVDSWGRERIDGYAHYAACLAGSSSSSSCSFSVVDVVRLQCLRPADGFWDTISRHFIGGRRHFDFVRFFSAASAESSAAETQPLHSRYRCRMQSTGELMLSCQRLSQRNCELLQPCRTTGMTLDDIMLAYREARRRLEAVVL